MNEQTIIVRERTIILKQIELPSGTIRPQITIPKDKILFWMRGFQSQQASNGAYVSQNIADIGGKIQLLDTTAKEAVRVTSAELDILDMEF